MAHRVGQKIKTPPCQECPCACRTATAPKKATRHITSRIVAPRDAADEPTSEETGRSPASTRARVLCGRALVLLSSEFRRPSKNIGSARLADTEIGQLVRLPISPEGQELIGDFGLRPEDRSVGRAHLLTDNAAILKRGTWKGTPFHLHWKDEDGPVSSRGFHGLHYGYRRARRLMKQSVH